MKLTENLLNVVKTLGKETQETSVETLAKKLNKTTNSVRSTLSVPNYKQYFKINDNNVVNGKVVKLYSLSQEGLNLLNQKENN